MNLPGEGVALLQTKLIIEALDKKLSNKQYKKLVQTIYGKQLEKFTDLNRIQRRAKVNNFFTEVKQGSLNSPSLLTKKGKAKVLNKKHRENIAEQGSQ